MLAIDPVTVSGSPFTTLSIWSGWMMTQRGSGMAVIFEIGGTNDLPSGSNIVRNSGLNKVY
jgi:hypothetical protein